MPLSYELVKNDAYEAIDPKFNLVVRKFAQAFTQAYEVPDPIVSGRVALICSLLSSSYFLHFAGVQEWLNDLRFVDLDTVPVSLNMRRIAAELHRARRSAGAPAPPAGRD